MQIKDPSVLPQLAFWWQLCLCSRSVVLHSSMSANEMEKTLQMTSLVKTTAIHLWAIWSSTFQPCLHCLHALSDYAFTYVTEYSCVDEKNINKIRWRIMTRHLISGVIKYPLHIFFPKALNELLLTQCIIVLIPFGYQIVVMIHEKMSFVHITPSL